MTTVVSQNREGEWVKGAPSSAGQSDPVELENRHRISETEIVRLLEQCRFDLSSEKHLQEDIEKVLEAAGITFEREKRLSSKDIPDFLVEGGHCDRMQDAQKGQKD